MNIQELPQYVSEWTEALGTLGPWVTAAVILILGWLVAKTVQIILVGILNQTSIDERVARSLGLRDAQTEKAIGKFVYYLILLFVFVAALDAAQLSDEVTKPLRNILDQITAYLPNVLGAGLLAFVTFAIATIVKNILQGVLTASRLDERLGLGEEKPLSNAIVTVVFFLIILIVLPSILGVLGIPGVADTVTPLVQTIIDYIPRLFGGGLIIGFGVLVGSIVRKMLTALLMATGIDTLPERLGYARSRILFGQTPSGAIGYIAMISIVVTTLASGIQFMELGLLSDLAGFLARFWAATLIFLIGLFLGDLAKRAIQGRNSLFATIAQYLVIFFFGGMALQKAQITELSSNVVQYLVTGAIIAAVVALGVGGAIAIGLGAKEEVQKFFAKHSDH